jgi:hypothetical protein
MTPKNPDPRPGAGKEAPSTGPRQTPNPSEHMPRFDDRPETPRKTGTSGQVNPDLPRYGDTEPDDPRRTDIADEDVEDVDQIEPVEEDEESS